MSRKAPNDEEENVEWGSEVLSEAGLQLHRLFDYFPRRDLRKQLEIVCCFSSASLSLLDGKLPDNLFSALLRAVEFQESRVLFVLPSSSSSSLPSSWLRDFIAPLLTVDSEGNCRVEEQPETAPIWKGGVRFCCDQIRCHLSGFQLFASEDEEESKLSAVPLAPARWIDVIRPIDSGDFFPLLHSGRRLSLCLQSPSCSDTAALIRFIRTSSGFFCRLPLYSASADFSGGKQAEEEDFIPPSERWASQLLSDLRSDEAPSSMPSPSICLSFLLLPSSSFASSQISSHLLPCDVILLRQSWQLPLPLLLRATMTSNEEVNEEMSDEDKAAFDKALEEVLARSPSENAQENGSPVTPQEGVDKKTEASRGLSSLLKSYVASRQSGAARPEMIVPLLQRQCSEKSEGRPSLTRKDSEGADHLIEQLLRAFRSDGTPAESPLEIVKPQHRSIVDKVDDPTQLDWPHAANVFYHGIYYNRGPWCEKRAERLSKLQTAAIPQETMCTVTRFGCRGNVASSRPSGPTKDARNKRKEPAHQEKPQPSEQQLSRSQRHEEKLRAVVSQVLAQEGVLPSDRRYAALSFNLFAATKTVIRLQKLPNSRNLRQKMEEAAKLQFQVIKQLTTG